MSQEHKDRPSEDSTNSTETADRAAAQGPRKNHGDVNEELVPGRDGSEVRAEREGREERSEGSSAR